MKKDTFDTLSEAMNALTKEGYKENFITREDKFYGLYSQQTFAPDDLWINHSYRFEGMTNPADATELFALETTDGTKGTLSMSYGADNEHNTDLIRSLETKPN